MPLLPHITRNPPLGSRAPKLVRQARQIALPAESGFQGPAPRAFRSAEENQKT